MSADLSSSSSASITSIEGRIRQLEIQLGLVTYHDGDPDIEYRLQHMERFFTDGHKSGVSATSSFQSNNIDTSATSKAATGLGSPSSNSNHNNNASTSTTAGVATSSSTGTTAVTSTVASSSASYYHDVTNMIQIYQEIDKLMEELSPGTALTHQTKSGINTAPILYRKQEILSSSDSLKKAMNYIATILHTLSIQNDFISSSVTKNSSITEQQVVNAPILLQTITHEQQEQLDTLMNKFHNIQERIINVSQQCEYMIYHYQQLIRSISEQLILYHESIGAIQDKVNPFTQLI